MLLGKSGDYKVEFNEKKKKKRRLKLTDFQAQIVQHELDHLEGIVI